MLSCNLCALLLASVSLATCPQSLGVRRNPRRRGSASPDEILSRGGVEISDENPDYAETSSNSSMVESSRRRPCDKDSVKRNRHSGSSTPRAFMIAHAHGRTQLESFASSSDVKWSTWWSDFVTRIEYDGDFNEKRRKSSCDGSTEYFRWGLEKLAKVTAYKYPGGFWQQEFAVLNPIATYTKTVSVSMGRSFASERSLTEEVGVEVGIAIDVFSASESFKFIASTQSTRTWSRSTTTTQTWQISAGGPSVVVWHYVLTCQGYNEVDMLLDTAYFKTNIMINTPDLRPPTCSPNNLGSCANSMALDES